MCQHLSVSRRRVSAAGWQLPAGTCEGAWVGMAGALAGHGMARITAETWHAHARTRTHTERTPMQARPNACAPAAAKWLGLA